MRRESLNDLHAGVGNGEQSVGGSAGSARPLGAFEHLFWLVDQHRPIHFTVTAEIEGKTRPEDWREAPPGGKRNGERVSLANRSRITASASPSSRRNG